MWLGKHLVSVKCPALKGCHSSTQSLKSLCAGITAERHCLDGRNQLLLSPGKEAQGGRCCDFSKVTQKASKLEPDPQLMILRCLHFTYR